MIGALIALPILAGGGVAAFAASTGTTGTSPAATFLADVASHLGISTATLQSAVQQARLDQVQQMLSAGKITSAQAAKMDAAITSGQAGLGFGPGPMGRRGGLRGDGTALGAAATYLGLTAQDLRSDFAAGKTLADVAGATSGKTVAGLEAAITAAMQQEMQQAVTSGKVTQAQATARQAGLATFVQNFVNSTPGAHGRGGPWGAPPNGAPAGGPPSSN